MALRAGSGRLRAMWDDWSGGELGLLSRDNAKPGMFTGTNVLVNQAGHLIPRSGLLQYTALTGWPGGKTLRHVGWPGLNAPFDFYLIDSDGHVRSVLGGAVSAAYAGTVFDTPPPASTGYPVYEGYIDTSHVSFIAGSHGGVAVVYVVSHEAATVTTVAVPALTNNVAAIGFYQDLFIAHDGARRFVFNDPATGTWPATNFIDVKGNGSISAILPMHTFLLIGFTSGEWWALTGTPGAGDDALHLIYAGHSPNEGPVDSSLTTLGAAVINGGQPWFVPNISARLGAGAYPSVFSGSTVRDIRWLANLVDPFGSAVLPLPPAGDFVIIDGATFASIAPVTAYVHKSNVFTTHLLLVQSATGGVLSGLVAQTDTGVVLADNSPIPNLYTWDPAGDETPPGAGTPTTDGPTSFTSTATLPNLWAPVDQQYALRSITIDFNAFDNGVSDPTIFVTAVALGVDDALPRIVGFSAPTWTQPRATFSTAGTEFRHTFTASGVFGDGCRISMTGLNGVEIRRVSASFDVRQAFG